MIEVISLSGHLSNIDEIRIKQIPSKDFLQNQPNPKHNKLTVRYNNETMALLDSSGVAALNISFSAANCVINVGPKFGQRNPQHGWVSATTFLSFLFFLFIHTMQTFTRVYEVSVGFPCNIYRKGV